MVYGPADSTQARYDNYSPPPQSTEPPPDNQHLSYCRCEVIFVLIREVHDRAGVAVAVTTEVVSAGFRPTPAIIAVVDHTPSPLVVAIVGDYNASSPSSVVFVVVIVVGQGDFARCGQRAKTDGELGRGGAVSTAATATTTIVLHTSTIHPQILLIMRLPGLRLSNTTKS